MPQIQGSSSSEGGRLDGSLQKHTLTAANFALGAGWGDGEEVTITVAEGSTDQRGSVTIVSDGSNQAQATATVTLTFADGAYAAAPFALVQLSDNDNAVTTAQPTGITVTTTALSWTAAVTPVDTKEYTFTWAVIA